MKNLLKTLAIVAVAVLTFTSCNPLNKKYSEEHFPEDMKAIVDSKKVDSTDLMSLTMYIVGAKMTGQSLAGKTYQDMLNTCHELRKKEEEKEAAEKAAEAKAKAEEAARADRLGKVVMVTLTDKGYESDEYGIENYLSYKIALANKSDKEVKAIKGKLQINDLFDAEIKTVGITFDDGLAANATANEVYRTRYNEYESNDVTLKNKDLKSLKVSWIPEKIIFADGSSLE